MKILVAALLIFSPFLIEDVLACQCVSVSTIYDSVKEAKAVFVGKTLGSRIVESEKFHTDKYGENVRSIYKEKVFKFEMEENFKGTAKKEIEINNGYVDDMCESGFEVGKNYLIYAYGNNQNEMTTSNFCSLNEELKNADAQIYFIRELLKGKPEPQIYGAITLLDNGAKNKIKGIKIIVKGKGKQFVTVTDEKGLFRLNKIPKGFYSIKPVVSSLYKIDYPEKQEFLVIPSGRIYRGFDLVVLKDFFSQYKISDKGINELFESTKRVSNGFYTEFTIIRNEEIKQNQANQKNN